jgi:hypothetical protein
MASTRSTTFVDQGADFANGNLAGYFRRARPDVARQGAPDVPFVMMSVAMVARLSSDKLYFSMFSLDLILANKTFASLRPQHREMFFAKGEGEWAFLISCDKLYRAALSIFSSRCGGQSVRSYKDDNIAGPVGEPVDTN